MNQLIHPFIPGAYYHVTSHTYNHLPIFKDQPFAQIAYDDFDFYGSKYNLVNIAYIVMNNHIHWLFQPNEQNFNNFVKQQLENNGKYASNPDQFYLVKILEDYKRHVAYQINNIRNTHGTKIWHQGFYDRIINTNEAVKQAANYIIFNSVNDGLVDNPEDYPFVGGIALDW